MLVTVVGRIFRPPIVGNDVFLTAGSNYKAAKRDMT